MKVRHIGRVPYGQRVADLVHWVIENYHEEVLRQLGGDRPQ